MYQVAKDNDRELEMVRHQELDDIWSQARCLCFLPHEPIGAARSDNCRIEEGLAEAAVDLIWVGGVARRLRSLWALGDQPDSAWARKGKLSSIR